MGTFAPDGTPLPPQEALAEVRRQREAAAAQRQLRQDAEQAVGGLEAAVALLRDQLKSARPLPLPVDAFGGFRSLSVGCVR